MENYYFTFGSWEKFPYQNTYIIVRAIDRVDATATYRNKYPDINKDTVCCSDIYSEDEWKRVSGYYEDVEPAEILVSDKCVLRKLSDNKKEKTLYRIRQCLDEWEEEVAKIGNECAYTDRILDKLPELVEQLTKIN